MISSAAESTHVQYSTCKFYIGSFSARSIITRKKKLKKNDKNCGLIRPNGWIKTSRLCCLHYDDATRNDELIIIKAQLKHTSIIIKANKEEKIQSSCAFQLTKSPVWYLISSSSMYTSCYVHECLIICQHQEVWVRSSCQSSGGPLSRTKSSIIAIVQTTNTM